MKIVVTMNLTDEHKAALRHAAPEAVFMYGDRDLLKRSDIEDAAVILGNCDPHLLDGLPALKWIQLNNAGAEGFWNSGLVPAGVVVTNASGAYGEVMAEHVLAVLLALLKRLPVYYAQQRNHRWMPAGQAVVLRNSTALIAGFGDIGHCTARLLRAFGCRIIACSRTASGPDADADEWCTPATIDEKIPEASVIVMSLPANDETYHFLDRKRIGLMKESALIVNVGRGSTLDTEALADALAMKKIAGAALDVTDPEPLPADSRLWNYENCIITPHISGKHDVPYALDRIVAICVQNLVRFTAGEPLLNVVDSRTGYRRAGNHAE